MVTETLRLIPLNVFSIALAYLQTQNFVTNTNEQRHSKFITRVSFSKVAQSENRMTYDGTLVNR